MPPTTLSCLRFHKMDRYSNPIFITGDAAYESDNFETLKTTAAKVKSKYPDVFSPVYYSQAYNFATIRFQANKQFEPQAGKLYTVTYEFRVKQFDGVNNLKCIMTDMKCDGDDVKTRGIVVDL